MNTTSFLSSHDSNKRIFTALAIAAVSWLVAYNIIQPISDWIAYSAFGFARNSHFGESLAFFLYDVPKILLLLSGMATFLTDKIFIRYLNSNEFTGTVPSEIGKLTMLREL